MKKQYFKFAVPALVLSLVALIGCGGKTVQSHWKTSEITIDGRSNDWSKYPTEYYDKDNLQFVLGVVNNDSSLDMLIKFNDARLARMFERRGVTLWLNGDGKKDKIYGIQYIDPAAGMMDSPAVDMSGRGGRPQMNARQSFESHGVFSLETSDTVSIPPDGLNGVEAKAGFLDGIYCYEIKVPLQTDDNSAYALQVLPGKKINLGIEIAPVSKEEQDRIKEMISERQKNGSGPAGGHGGGMRGGGMPGGGMPGGDMPDGGMRGGGFRGGNGMMSGMVGQEIWLNVVLANAK